MMRGNIVTGAVDGQGQEEEEKKLPVKKGDILLAPLEQCFWEKKRSSSSFMRCYKCTEAGKASIHSGTPRSHSFISCVINLRQTRPSTSDAQHVPSWILSSSDERVLRVSVSLLSVRHGKVAATPLSSRSAHRGFTITCLPFILPITVIGKLNE